MILNWIVGIVMEPNIQPNVLKAGYTKDGHEKINCM